MFKCHFRQIDEYRPWYAFGLEAHTSTNLHHMKSFDPKHRKQYWEQVKAKCETTYCNLLQWVFFLTAGVHFFKLLFK